LVLPQHRLASFESSKKTIAAVFPFQIPIAAVFLFQIFDCLVKPTMREQGLQGLYPVMSTLLRFSTKEFLNVLSLVKSISAKFCSIPSACLASYAALNLLLSPAVKKCSCVTESERSNDLRTKESGKKIDDYLSTCCIIN